MKCKSIWGGNTKTVLNESVVYNMIINRINNNDMVLTVSYRLLQYEIESVNYIDCFIKSCDAENDEQLIDAVHAWLNTEIHMPYEIITIEYINFATGQKYRIV